MTSDARPSAGLSSLLAGVLAPSESILDGPYLVRPFIGSGATWASLCPLSLQVLVIDRSRKSTEIRAYAIDAASKAVLRRPVLAAELYFELRYLVLLKAFHALEVDDGVLGFQFASESEAAEFHRKIEQFRPRPESMVSAGLPTGLGAAAAGAAGGPAPGFMHMVSTGSAASSSTAGNGTAGAMPAAAPAAAAGGGGGSAAAADKATAADGTGADGHGKRRSSIFSSLFGGGRRSSVGSDGGKGGSSGGSGKEPVIGGIVPGSVRHEGHVGLTADGTFDAANLPAEWRAMFRSLGVKRRDLERDPDLARSLCAVLADAPAVQQAREAAVERERHRVLNSIAVGAGAGAGSPLAAHLMAGGGGDVAQPSQAAVAAPEGPTGAGIAGANFSAQRRKAAPPPPGGAAAPAAAAVSPTGPSRRSVRAPSSTAIPAVQATAVVAAPGGGLFSDSDSDGDAAGKHGGAARLGGAADVAPSPSLRPTLAVPGAGEPSTPHGDATSGTEGAPLASADSAGSTRSAGSAGSRSLPAVPGAPGAAAPRAVNVKGLPEHGRAGTMIVHHHESSDGTTPEQEPVAAAAAPAAEPAPVAPATQGPPPLPPRRRATVTERPALAADATAATEAPAPAPAPAPAAAEETAAAAATGIESTPEGGEAAAPAAKPPVPHGGARGSVAGGGILDSIKGFDRSRLQSSAGPGLAAAATAAGNSPGKGPGRAPSGVVPPPGAAGGGQQSLYDRLRTVVEAKRVAITGKKSGGGEESDSESSDSGWDD